MRRTQYHEGSLAAELARLPDLSREDLLERWGMLYGSKAPSGVSKQFLIRAIAYRMQENVFGGLKLATRKFLAQVVEDSAVGRQLSAVPATIKPGTRLIREWHGKTYEVEILADAVLFRD